MTTSASRPSTPPTRALRGLLIELHQAVEAAGDAPTDAKILALYVRMAAGRRM